MKAPLFALVILVLGAFAAPALAGGYTVTAQSDAPSYVATARITISGTVSPAPGPNTAVIVVISDPIGIAVDIQDDPVDGSTGTFSQVTVAGGGTSCGGGSCWTAGRYFVNVTWGGRGASAVAVTTFEYSPLAPSSASVSCLPVALSVGAASQCTASVSGAGPSMDGESVSFSQAGGTGSVSFPSPATCPLSGKSCSVAVKGISPGTVNIEVSYPGDSYYTASSANASLTVQQAKTATSVTCEPASVEVGGVSTCTATISGWVGAPTGESFEFSQQPPVNGSVTFPSGPACVLGAGGSCYVSLIAATPGAVTIEAAYPGDANNAASSGTASIVALYPQSTTSTTSTSTPSTTSSTSTVSSTSITGVTTSSQTSTQPSGGAPRLAVFAALGVVAAAIVLVALLLRRRAASANPKTAGASRPAPGSSGSG